MTSAKIIADSLNEKTGNRLTSFIITYARYVHAELMTHRMFSRNSASSRAIPVAKLMDQIRTDPVIPTVWPKNEPGMSASFNFDPKSQEGIDIRIEWLQARDRALESTGILSGLGLHKQVANRVLEPWMYITVLVSATDWTNFFNLRVHKDAHPDIQLVAYQMLKLYLGNEHLVKRATPGDWHLPFSEKMYPDLALPDRIKICVARCARLSYNTFDGPMDIDKDFDIYNKLAKTLKTGEPKHLSPFEHCAQAMPEGRYFANFEGWQQYRTQLEQQNPEPVIDLRKLLEDYENGKR